ncbi:MAG: low molecular weight phosphotyrosine protein phosphatase [Kordiimonadaceae bacterium]|nr:low molecular weight phosphotyrosine protein phosphatase [Kordiimonadaceae bacterium]
MGNICRSPMAEGAFQAAVDAADLNSDITMDSAGTIGFHAGSPPDPRACRTAQNNGISISHQQSRKVRASDFAEFDYILAMDTDNFEDLLAQCPPDYKARIHMFLSFAPDVPLTEMPDPYYGEDDGFRLCFSVATKAAAGLLAKIQATDL